LCYSALLFCEFLSPAKGFDTGQVRFAPCLSGWWKWWDRKTARGRGAVCVKRGADVGLAWEMEEATQRAPQSNLATMPVVAER